MRKFLVKVGAMLSLFGAFIGISICDANATVSKTQSPFVFKIDASSPFYLDQAKLAVAQHQEQELAWHQSHSSHYSHSSHASHHSHRSGY